jgi:hypothetical protein
MKQFLDIDRVLLTEAAEKTLTFGIKNNGTLPFVTIDGETFYFGKYCDFTKLTYTRFNPENYAVYITKQYTCIIEIDSNPFTREKVTRMKTHSANALQAIYNILHENGVTYQMTHPNDVVWAVKDLIKRLSVPPVAPTPQEEELHEEVPDEFVELEHALECFKDGEPVYTPEINYFNKFKVEVHIPVGYTIDSIYRNVHIYVGSDAFDGYVLLDIKNIALDIDTDIFKAVIEQFKYDYKDALPSDPAFIYESSSVIPKCITKYYTIK